MVKAVPVGTEKPKICFLIALWGESYISMFFDLSLRTLLAEGNIPAMAKEYTCCFTFLTTTKDKPLFEKQRFFPNLIKYCDVNYVDIEDTIFSNNHSATLTIALERGMRAWGSEMLNTYFIFLVADYLFASHSLSGLLPHLRAGVSAITAGNYQVVKEEVTEELTFWGRQGDGTVSIPNRELVAWSLRHLHPVTVANMISEGDIHAQHTNRLFWRPDADTLIGRFYLKHMLCVKPEITDYVIGSSCDYSFVEEMCPSGNVAHLSDSDEYFVVELQPLGHESKYIFAKAPEKENIARGLASWATREQRANALRPILFHAGDITEHARDVMDQSEAYVQSLAALMRRPASPVRGHYYWLSCIQWISANFACKSPKYTPQILNLRKNVWESPTFGPALRNAGASIDKFPPMNDEEVDAQSAPMLKLVKAYIRIFGAAPNVRRWHPRYLDYRLLLEALVQSRPGKTLFVLQPKRLPWLELSHRPDFELRTPLIMYRKTEELREELKDFSNCVIQLARGYEQTGNLIDHLTQVMPEGSNIHIFVTPPLITRSFMFGSLNFSTQYLAMRFGYFSQKSGLRFLGQRLYRGTIRCYMDQHLSDCAVLLLRNRQRPLRVAWYGTQIGLLHLCYAVLNLISPITQALGIPAGKTLCSAVLSFKVEP